MNKRYRSSSEGVTFAEYCKAMVERELRQPIQYCASVLRIEMYSKRTRNDVKPAKIAQCSSVPNWFIGIFRKLWRLLW